MISFEGPTPLRSIFREKYAGKTPKVIITNDVKTAKLKRICAVNYVITGD